MQERTPDRLMKTRIFWPVAESLQDRRPWNRRSGQQLVRVRLTSVAYPSFSCVISWVRERQPVAWFFGSRGLQWLKHAY